MDERREFESENKIVKIEEVLDEKPPEEEQVFNPR